jgi:hypothetical protein
MMIKKQRSKFWRRKFLPLGLALLTLIAGGGVAKAVPVPQVQGSTAQATTVTGLVLDENGEPVIGATVSVKGSNVTTVTDFDGHFTLKNVPKDSKVKVTYVGYESVVVSAKDGMTITLKPSDNVLLGEVCVVVNSHAKNAQYPGGDKALQKFIKKNFALPDEITGREYVMIEVDVDKKGNVSNPRILNEIGTAFEKEALRVAGLIKKIKPARDAKGKKTDSTFSIVFDSSNWTN